VSRIRIPLIRIRFQHFRLYTDPDPDPIRIQGFDDKKFIFLAMKLKKNLIFWGSKTRVKFIYPLGLQKDIQATEEASSPQKRTSSTSKHEISKYFSTFMGHFCLLDPEPDSETDPLL
jgi:hypothetical protein